jgi:hypothetical protein
MELERKRERGDSSMELELERKRERVEFFLEPERERMYEPFRKIARVGASRSEPGVWYSRDMEYC